jgi:hypothetical protein
MRKRKAKDRMGTAHMKAYKEKREDIAGGN